jgi:hypothetical protein
LEVNGVKEFQLSQWERSLRSYCSSETERGDGIDRDTKDGTEWHSYYGDGSAIFDVDFIPQLQSGQIGFVNFQERNIPICKLIKIGDYLGRDRARMPTQGYSDALTLSMSFWIGYDVQRSHDPSIRIDDKSATAHRVGINLNYRLLDFPANIELRRWFRDLAINCRARKEENKSTVQPHGPTLSAGEAH